MQRKRQEVPSFTSSHAACMYPSAGWSYGAVSTAVRTGYQPLSACRRRVKIEKGGGEGERDWGISGFDSKRFYKNPKTSLKTDLDNWVC